MNSKLIVLLALIFFLSATSLTNQQFRNNLTGLINSPAKRENAIQEAQRKAFASTYQEFTVQLPESYEAEENPPIVNFKNGEVVVILVRNTTPFDTLGESLKDYDDKNKLKNVSEEKGVEINGHQAITRLEVRGTRPTQKVYYIYVNNWLYIISTEFESAFPDLDQIAQSFRYTP